MRITECDFRPFRNPQPQLNPGRVAIEIIIGACRWKPQSASREETAVPVIPGPEPGVTGPDITTVRLGETHGHVVIVVLEKSVAVDGERAFIHRLLVMEIRDAAEQITPGMMLLPELGVVTGDIEPANRQLNPIRRRTFLLCCRRGGPVLVDLGFPGSCRQRGDQRANSGDDKRAFHLVAEMLVYLRTVNRFMAVGRPARSLLQPAGVITVADKNFAVARLLLEMAFQAKIRAALREQFLVHRAVRCMAGNTTLANRFVFENERAPLRGVTLQTGSIRAQHGEAAALHG